MYVCRKPSNSNYIWGFFLEEEGNKIYNLGQENAFSDATRVYLGKNRVTSKSNHFYEIVFSC